MDAILFRTRHPTGLLLADLAAATSAAAWISRPDRGRYHDWSALPLHALHGQTTAESDTHIDPARPEDCAPTPILSVCPAVREVLASLPAAKLRVRFMRLAPGGVIGLHRDRQYGWDLPVLRLHIPISTNPGVEFRLGDTRLDMRPGEQWYLDTTRDHEVHNRGATDRVHLVIDLVNTPQLRAHLGPHTWSRTIP